MKRILTTCILSLTIGLASAQTDNSSVLAYPNPAKYDVSFNYTVQAANGPVTIIVTDMIGGKVAEFPIKEKQGVISWSTSSIPNGIYIYKLKDSAKTIAIGRLTIAK
jgi:hypothetical protein